ncbi:MAG: 2-oxoglutarate dehydrogenase complex dihydrolipoyllysine-residue succinyltransferase [Ardenticatenaceae bacterium]|nr:2-oxoglutarate dehydrogenase complex dihydrolipoyllysine-residue succinyltransferase [Ardenticatenaceae bacterium]
MTINVKVPELGESVVEATVGQWHKQEGDTVAVGEVLVDLETDKVDVEVGAEAAGVLVTIQRQAGEDVQIGDVLAEIDPEGAAAEPESTGQQPAAKAEEGTETETAVSAASPSPPARKTSQATPVAQRMAQDKDVDLSQINGSGQNNRITRDDVEQYLQERQQAAETTTTAPKRPSAPPQQPATPTETAVGDHREERQRLSRRRRTIAQRLVEAQHTAAMLTTFNDVDMSAVIDLRQRRGEAFRERQNVKLGFMSFFVKAAVGALKDFPRLNAEIDGDEVILKHYYDIGMAVGAEEGLVVPVIRHADRLSFAEIEQAVRRFAEQAREGTLSLEDLRGGSFTITNGGVFGSMLSTPILNPPQVGILGLHRIEERPVARKGAVIIRPMMYLALSYDHRLVDGREAVQFLGRIKELVEDPETLLLEG